MSMVSETLGFSEDRANKICQDIDDILKIGGPRIHDIGQELVILAAQYSGTELAFAAYVYGRRIQHHVHVFKALGLNVEIMDMGVKKQ